MGLKKEQIRQVLKLLRQWTREEILARHAPFRNLEFSDHYMIKIDKENELRELLYGTSNLVELGDQWGLLRPPMVEQKRKRLLKKLVKAEKQKQKQEQKAKKTLLGPT